MKVCDETISRFETVFEPFKLFLDKNSEGNIIVLHARDKILLSGYKALWSAGVDSIELTMKQMPVQIWLEPEDLKRYVKHVPLHEVPVVEELSSIPGIMQLGAAPYLFSIQKAVAFTWDELVPQILEAWKTYQLKKEFK